MVWGPGGFWAGPFPPKHSQKIILQGFPYFPKKSLGPLALHGDPLLPLCGAGLLCPLVDSFLPIDPGPVGSKIHFLPARTPRRIPYPKCALVTAGSEIGQFGSMAYYWGRHQWGRQENHVKHCSFELWAVWWSDCFFFRFEEVGFV